MGETHLQPGEAGRQHRRGMLPAPKDADYHDRKNGQADRAVQQQKIESGGRVASRRLHRPSESNDHDRERRDKPVNGARGATIAVAVGGGVVLRGQHELEAVTASWRLAPARR